MVNSYLVSKGHSAFTLRAELWLLAPTFLPNASNYLQMDVASIPKDLPCSRCSSDDGLLSFIHHAVYLVSSNVVEEHASAST